MSLGDFVMGDYVAGGFCHGGFCHGGFCHGGFCRRFKLSILLIDFIFDEILAYGILTAFIYGLLMLIDNFL